MKPAPQLTAAAERMSLRSRLAGGQPIGFLMHKALVNPDLISLAAGFVDQASLPVAETQQAFDHLFSDPRRARTALQYGLTAGHPPLREAVLEALLTADGRPPAEQGMNVEQVVMTAGSNQLLHLLADTLFDPGDIVLCAGPSYFVYLGVLRNLGVQPLVVASDEQGLIPEALEEQLQALAAGGLLPRVKALYLVSYFDNPGSITLAADRRGPIVETIKRWSRHGRIHVIDDLAYRELRYYGADTPSLRAYDEDGDTVIVAQTFSKSYSPGVRVGWGILPPDLVEPVCNQKGNIDFGSAHLNQLLMTTVLEQGLHEPHLQVLRATYREKMDAMLAALDEHFSDVPGAHWARPEGGLYVWFGAPQDVDTGPRGRLFDLAVEEGMLYVPGEYCYPAPDAASTVPEQPAPRNMIRLSFGVQSPARIKEGIAALARAVRRAQQGPNP